MRNITVHSIFLSLFMITLAGCGACDEPDKPPVKQPVTMAFSCEDNLSCSTGLACHSTAHNQGRCTRSCATTECPSGSACLDDGNEYWGPWQKLCVATCDMDASDCPEGLVCTTHNAQDICLPPQKRPPQSETSWAQIKTALNVKCNATAGEIRPEDQWKIYTMDFTLPAGTKRAWISPFVVSGRVEMLSMTTGSQPIDFQQTYIHHNNRFNFLDSASGIKKVGTFGEFSMDWPVLLPYAPQFASLLETEKTYTLRVATESEAPCLHVWPETENRKVLQLNIYMTGVLGLKAQDAPFDDAMQIVIQHVRRLLINNTGLSRIEVDFIDLSTDLQNKYSIIRELNEIRILTSFGKPLGTDPYWIRALDVFMVQDFELEEIPGLVGFSGGLPGAPGMSGNYSQGLVFSSFMLGSDNIGLGTIIAHEIGHYLGLRHTTETFYSRMDEASLEYAKRLGRSDPLMDTPECPAILDNPYKCTDAANLMFPFTPISSVKAFELKLSPHQDFVISGP